jgi:hypothetical protein
VVVDDEEDEDEEVRSQSLDARDRDGLGWVILDDHSGVPRVSNQ